MRASSVAPGSRGVATYPTALCVEGDGHLAGSKRCGHSTDRPLVRDLTRSREWPRLPFRTDLGPPQPETKRAAKA